MNATDVSSLQRASSATVRKTKILFVGNMGFPISFAYVLTDLVRGLKKHYGHLYDVWTLKMMSSDWVKQHAFAAKKNAELWMYDCWLTGENPLLERFYAGLWTWRTAVKGNMVWAYGWYVRIKETGVPESKLAWEGRLAGVNDYRYLHTLEVAIAAAEAAGKANAALDAAKRFLEELRRRIPYTAYENRPRGARRALWNPVPEIQPQDYDRIRGKCARHIRALQSLLVD